MSSVLARTGRHRQRYDNHYRLVSGCIPYKLIKDDESGLENRIRILMISTPKRDDLVFPKGGWEDDETVREAACREALEEAGIRGNLKEKMLGVWEFRSKSSEERDRSGVKGGCRGYMFAMEVTLELEMWPEQQSHGRKWVKVEEAFKLCRYEWMRDALKKFLEVMAEEYDDIGRAVGGDVACTSSCVSDAVEGGRENVCEMINKASNSCLNSQEQQGIGSNSTPAGVLFGTRTPAAFPQQEVRVMALAYTN